MAMGEYSGNLHSELILAVPGSTLQTALDAVTDGNYSAWNKVNVYFAFANQDFEIEVTGANEVPDAYIESIRKVGDSYDVVVNLISMECPFEISITGIALGDYVESGAAGVWAKDNANGQYRVISYTTPKAGVVKIPGGIAAEQTFTAIGATFADLAAARTAVNTLKTEVEALVTKLKAAKLSK